jgi:phage terminase large subunit
VIETPGDGLMIFKGMNDYTADSIKSLEGFKRAWWEEAQTATATSLNLLRPTLRAPGSELWFSGTPAQDDPVDVMLRGAELPTGLGRRPGELARQPVVHCGAGAGAQDCLRMQPDQYDHIWEGGYVTVIEGRTTPSCLAEAKRTGRIGGSRLTRS